MVCMQLTHARVPLLVFPGTSIYCSITALALTAVSNAYSRSRDRLLNLNLDEVKSVLVLSYISE